MDWFRPRDGADLIASRRGARLRVGLLLMIVLSLLPLPLTAPAGVHAQEDAAIIPPPAKAVQLLERLRASGGLEQAATKRGGRKARRGQTKEQTINRKGCTFRQKGKTWTLVRNCTPKGTIVIPDGFTLNGHNRIMVVTGKIRKFDGAVVVAGFGRANIRNLRIEGNGKLNGPCSDLSAGILFFYAAGTISNVKVRNIEPGPIGCVNSAGIYALGDKRVNIVNSTIQSTGTASIVAQGLVGGKLSGNDLRIAARQSGTTNGIQLGGTANVVVSNNTFRPVGANQTIGLLAFDNANLSIFGNQFQSLFMGIQALAGQFAGRVSSVVIRDNHMTNVDSGFIISGGSVLLLRNTVAGPASRGTAGLTINIGTAGQANNNTFANFGCGVFSAPGSAFTLGTGAQANTFINNTDDFCP